MPLPLGFVPKIFEIKLLVDLNNERRPAEDSTFNTAVAAMLISPSIS